ncbi:alpha/beta-hydrolase [Zopfia rhizophila CBS 207.26]|uniref:Alpha/beta-hydrolase n=1 Tax=Zopfia rhizophila CBS 207.26 TaxID=1314779 RepID=A0A6A6DB95_9PEZI|nr:alpha/beta-hydrolase [Zopfia rhizophila CBS 207.26]
MASVILLLSQILLATANVSRSSHETHLPSPLTINTTSGVFVPYFPGTHPGVASFPDIPYAQNPTGPLRFAPPVPARPHGDGVVNATSLPAGCFQYVPPYIRGTVGVTAQKAAEFQRGDYTNTTEDCLRLSIFAPRAAVERAASRTSEKQDNGSKDLLPVVVWIHGGGFAFGGTNVPYQLAPNWVQRSQSHIVVQAQYRLNLLGLPNAAGLASNQSANHNLNLALLDQRLAVEWVRDNIARLGGDPGRITLWGESAGAYGVDGYLFAWAKDTIVAGVIANSGNALAIESTTVDASNHSSFSQAASRLGCGGLSPADELACMRAVPASAIQAYIQGPLSTGDAGDDALTFGTVVDNVTIFTDYAGRIARSQFAAGVPVLIGTNTNEGAAVVPYDFPGSEMATQLPAALAQMAQAFDLNLQCTTLREVGLRAKAGATTYQYLYGGNFSDVSPRPWLGAYHTAELPMVFGTYGTEGPVTEFERRVSESMQDLYLAFVKDPNNGLRKAGWPAATGMGEKTEVMKWAADGEVGKLVDVDGLRDECMEG